MNKSCLSVFIMIIGLVITIQAATKSVELAVSSTEVFESDVFDLNIVLNNFDVNDLSLQKISFGDKLKVLQGPFQSQQTSIINGQMSSSLTLIYRVTANAPGVISIPPVVITEGGGKYSSNTLVITVYDNKAKKNRSAKGLKSPDIFIRTIVSNKTPYLGEPLLLEKVLYIDPDLKIRKPEITDNSVLKGFMKEEKDLGVKGRSLTSKIYKGKKYNTVTVQEVILVPTRSGELEIPGTIISVPVLQKSRRRNSVFDDPFFNDDLFSSFSNFREKSLQSPKEIISVMELPEKGKPSDFSGVVGDFELESSISTTEVSIDNPITIKFSITGSGNIKLIENLNLHLLDEFEAYQPVRKENLTSSISGEVIIEQILIARQAGEFIIEPASFTYFNTAQKKYVTLNSPEYRIKVTGSRKNNYHAAIPDNFSKEDVRLIGKDISFIKSELGSVYSIGQIQNPFKYWLEYFVFVLFLPLIVFISKKYYDLKFADPVKLRKNQALRKARKSLKELKKISDQILIYEKISSIFYDFLADKMGLSQSSVVLNNILDNELSNLSADEKGKVRDIIIVAETIKYSPAVSAERDLRKDINFMQNFIIKINDLL